jgi:chromosome segregation ATPase
LAAKKEQTEIAAATLAGEFVSPEGIVFGGSREASADSLLERKARMSVLNTECSEIRKQRDGLLQKRDGASAILEKATSELEEARRQYASADQEQSASENRALFLERELQETEQKIDQLRSEQTTLVQQIQTADEHMMGLEERLHSERASLEAQRNQQSDIQAAQQTAANRENEATEQLNELRLAVATDRQRYEHLIAQRQPMTVRDVELAETIAARRTEIDNFEKRLTTQADESKNAESTIEKQKRQFADLEAALAGLADQRAERLAATNETESNLRAVRNSLNDLHDSRSKVQVRLAQLQLQTDNLAERVSRRYQLNIREFTPDQVAFEKTLRAN